MALTFSSLTLKVTVAVFTNPSNIVANEDPQPAITAVNQPCGLCDVAFSAYLTNRTASISNGTIVFDTEWLDNGDGYNPATGVYTVPVCGTYVFAFNVVIPESTEELIAYLKVQGEIKSSAIIMEGGYQAGNTVLLHLNANDTIYVDVVQGNDGYNGTLITGNQVAPSEFIGGLYFMGHKLI